MEDFSFATLRLGKTSVEDIKKIDSSVQGVQDSPFNIDVVCTQVPNELEIGAFVFLWLGSDNSKGMPTSWKQGFKAVGEVVNLSKGASYNDNSTTTVRIVYVFPEAVNRLDILRDAPQAYYWCSSMPIIGLDDHSNQTIRMMEGAAERSDIKAFFNVIDSSCKGFKVDILKVKPEFSRYFDYHVLNPQSKEKRVSSRSLDENQESDLQSYLTAIRTKPFILLAGISGTGKSRIVRKLAQATDDIDLFVNEDDRWKLHSPSNFCLIQVKPNWHNSMDVVGFKSNIGKSGEHYEYTPFIEFISKAWKNVDTPFFLCLDEMNLAPVEEYFAEFLSAIESRSFGEDDQYETDPIVKPFKDFGDKVALDMIEHLLGEHYDDVSSMSKEATRFYNKGLTLPKNLIVMGTVNMDETTFSFSRKVLDRAMSIEMNEVDYDAFLAGTTEDDIPVLTDRNIELVERPIKAMDIKTEIPADNVKDFLSAVNNILDGTPFKLGYRAANEAMLYVAAANKFGNSDLASALDDFTLMKVLSRIEGDDSKLKTKDGKDLLEELTVLFSGEQGMFKDMQHSKTLEKLDLMSKALDRDHFVSFWG